MLRQEGARPCGLWVWGVRALSRLINVPQVTAIKRGVAATLQRGASLQ